MPLFFMIAGYADGMKDRYSGQHTSSSFIKKAFIDLYLPCIYFSLIDWAFKFAILSTGNTENFRATTIETLYALPFGLYEYWFLASLFAVKCLHILLECHITRKVIISAFWAAAFIAVNCFRDILPSFIISMTNNGLYFYVGYVMMRRQYFPKNANILLGLLLFVSGVLLFLVPHVMHCANFFTHIGASFCQSMGLFVIFYALRIKNSFLASCGIFSMAIYCLHVQILSVMRLVYRFCGLHVMPSYILCIASSIIATVIPVIIMCMCRRVKCISWIEYIFYPGKLMKKNHP